jgi:hypothetical protein
LHEREKGAAFIIFSASIQRFAKHDPPTAAIDDVARVLTASEDTILDNGTINDGPIRADAFKQSHSEVLLEDLQKPGDTGQTVGEKT